MNDSDLRRVGKAEKALFDKICKKDDISRFITHSDEYIQRGDAIEAVQIRIKQIGYQNDAHVLSICQALRDVPAADVRPARYGKWEKRGWSIRCSECGYDMPFATRNFCPNCGADMRDANDGI